MSAAKDEQTILVTEETDDKWQAPLSAIFEPNPKDDTELFFASERDGYNHLYLAKLEAETRPVASVPAGGEQVGDKLGSKIPHRQGQYHSAHKRQLAGRVGKVELEATADRIFVDRRRTAADAIFLQSTSLARDQRTLPVPGTSWHEGHPQIAENQGQPNLSFSRLELEPPGLNYISV